MITAKFTLNWQGGEYSQRLHRELVRATQQSALRVQREAKKLLSVSGQASITPLGLNRAKGANVSKMTREEKNQRIFDQGIRQIKNLSIAGGVLQSTKDRFGNSSFFVKSTTKSGKSLVHGGNLSGIDRIYWNNATRRWTTSSQPGSPPHRQSGYLSRVAIEYTSGGLRAKIGPQNGLKYARIQELGGKGLVNLPPRPYMRPAFVSQEQAILFQFALAVQRAAK